MQLCGSLSILWHCLSLGLAWKRTFSSPVATAVFQICWHTECRTFTASSFRIWNSSTGIPSYPPALFIVMLSKAHLASHNEWLNTKVLTFNSFPEIQGKWKNNHLHSYHQIKYALSYRERHFLLPISLLKILNILCRILEKDMATHSSTLAWKLMGGAW